MMPDKKNPGVFGRAALSKCFVVLCFFPLKQMKLQFTTHAFFMMQLIQKLIPKTLKMNLNANLPVKQATPLTMKLFKYLRTQKKEPVDNQCDF